MFVFFIRLEGDNIGITAVHLLLPNQPRRELVLEQIDVTRDQILIALFWVAPLTFVEVAALAFLMFFVCLLYTSDAADE